MIVERKDVERAFGAIVGPPASLEVPPFWEGAFFKKPHHWFLSGVYSELDTALPGQQTAIALETWSRRVRFFWYNTMVDTFSAYYQLFQGQGTYDGGWIDSNKARLRVTAQPIEGPVDGTIYGVERTTPTEEGSVEFFLDEAGQPEEAMSPMKVVSKLKEGDGEVVEEITATFRQGRIEKLVRVEYKGDYTGENPPFTKRTEFDFSHVVRFLVRPRQAC